MRNRAHRSRSLWLVVVALLFGVAAVSATPVITAQPPATLRVPLGRDATISVSAQSPAGITYQWRKEGLSILGATNSTLILSKVQTNDNGAYNVLVRDPTGAVNSSTTLVTVVVRPTIITNTPSQSIPGGSDLLLQVSVSGTAPFQFQWRKDGALLQGATNQTLFLKDVTAADRGTYGVTVSNLAGSDQSDPIDIDVFFAPKITTTLQDQTVLPGARVAFGIEAQGSAPLRFQWFHDGTAINGATGNVYIIPAVHLADEGSYAVGVANQYGSDISSPAKLNVQANALPFADNFAAAGRITANYFAGIGTTVGATREPLEPLHDGKRTFRTIWIDWIAPATGIAGISTANSTFDTVLAVYRGQSLDNLTVMESDDDSGPQNTSALKFNADQGVVYHIAVGGFAFESGQVTFELELTPTNDRLPQILRQPRSIAVLENQPAVLDFDFQVDASGVQVQWLFASSPLVNATAKTNIIPIVTEDTVGRYRVRVSTATKSVESHSVDVQINSRGLSQVLAQDKMGDAIDFGLYAKRGTIGPGGKSRQKNGVGAGGYSGTQIFSTLGATADPGEPIHCGIGAGHSEWFVYEAETNGTLRIDTDGSNFDTVLAVYTGPGDSYATLANVACDNDSGRGGTNSRVVFTATMGTTYYIVVDGVSYAAKQTGTVKLHLNLGNPVTISDQPQSKIVFSGTSPSFLVGADGMTNYIYQWRFNGLPLANATNATLVRANVSALHAGTYDVIVGNPINSVTSQVASLTVLSTTINITTQPVSRVVFAGSNCQFVVGATGFGALGYQWHCNGTNIPIGITSAWMLTNAQAGNAGTYDVTISDANGIRASSNASLTVVASPVITLHPASQTVTPGNSALLTASASGMPAPALNWYFNNAPIGPGGPALTLLNFQASSEGTYFVRATNLVGTSVSAVAELFLNTPLRLTNFARTTGATYLRCVGVVNSNYVIQATTNFVTWTGMLTNASPSGVIDFVDTNNPGEQRYYRAKGQ